MLIVEGPDGSGKTTLIHRLSRDLDWPIAQRAVNSQTEALTDLTKWVEVNVRKGFQETIFDRHRLISEPIYGPILRPRAYWARAYDLDWTTDMTIKLYAARPLVILCMPPLKTVSDNLAGDLDNAMIYPYIDRIYRGYVAASATIMAFMANRANVYDYTRDDYSLTLKWVKARIRERGGKYFV